MEWYKETKAFHSCKIFITTEILENATLGHTGTQIIEILFRSALIPIEKITGQMVSRAFNEFCSVIDIFKEIPMPLRSEEVCKTAMTLAFGKKTMKHFSKERFLNYRITKEILQNNSSDLNEYDIINL